ncbi:MAG: DUF805 domain-containing protein [Sphingomonas sp.]
MLHNILGFGGRMGRLEYFLARLGLGILVGLLTLALIFGFMPHLGHGERGPVPIGLAVILLAVVLPIYLWFALAFQAKRLRDMGWNPVYFIPGSIMLFVTLQYAARTVPSLVMVSALLNLAQCLCLWFWPSAPTGDGDWYSGPYHERSPGPEPVMDRTPASSSRRAATVLTPAPPPVFTPAPSGFGRRGL